MTNKYCSPANFDCDSGFRVYFLFNSFTKHRSSNLQLSPDCLVQYINCKFNNQFSVHYLTMRLRQHKQNSQVQNLPCRSSLKQQRYVCIMSVNKSQIHARNKCFLYKIRTETDEKTPPMVYAIWRHQFSDLTSYLSSQSNSRGHASNITCQKLQWSEIEPPQ